MRYFTKKNFSGSRVGRSANCSWAGTSRASLNPKGSGKLYDPPFRTKLPSFSLSFFSQTYNLADDVECVLDLRGSLGEGLEREMRWIDDSTRLVDDVRFFEGPQYQGIGGIESILQGYVTPVSDHVAERKGRDTNDGSRSGKNCDAPT